jgi:succinate dehydrogenase hydrophobic anchor subunit
VNPGDHTPPSKRHSLIWLTAIAALIGLAIGLHNLWKDFFYPDPEFPDNYLILSYLLDTVTVLACGTAIFFLFKARNSGK